MIKQFKEIESFFLQDSFTKDSLDELIFEIGQKYTDSTIVNTAKSLIKLELLKFELLGQPKIDENAPKTQKSSRSDKLESLIKYRICDLVEKLQWSSKYFLRLLTQRNINKDPNDFLNPEEFLLIKPLVNARLKGIQRNRKAESKIKQASRFRKRSLTNKPHGPDVNTNKSDVYDKLALFGQGKLIYIRSR